MTLRREDDRLLRGRGPLRRRRRPPRPAVDARGALLRRPCPPARRRRRGRAGAAGRPRRPARPRTCPSFRRSRCGSGPSRATSSPTCSRRSRATACATSASRWRWCAPRTRTSPRTPPSSCARDHEELPPVLDARDGAAADAPALRDDHGNECTTLRRGYGDVEAAFAAAAHVVSLELHVGRHSAVPLETRGLRRRVRPGRGPLHRLGRDQGAALQPRHPRRGARRAARARVAAALRRRRRLRRPRRALSRGPPGALPRARGSGGR